MKSEFTGRHMAAITIAGFGIVIAVNLLMATLAVRGFGGVVVPNSYVASQKFNGWLEAADRQKSLGWSATVTRTEDGRIMLATTDVPRNAKILAIAHRPLGKPEITPLRFREEGRSEFVSTRPLADGRWIIRFTIKSGHLTWAAQQQVS